MPEITLSAEVGRTLGTRPSKRLRGDGKIPGVIYGHGTEPVSVAVEAKALRTALTGDAGTNALLSLVAHDKTFLTVARELQRHPVKGTVIHVDFQIVRRDEVIAADVPVVLIGEAIEVHHGDGLVDQQLFNLPVRALPADIPTVIEVDISTLVIGAALRISDLSLPAGVTTDLDDDVPIAIGQPPRVQVLEGEASTPGEGELAPSEAGAPGGQTTGGAEGTATGGE